MSDWLPVEGRVDSPPLTHDRPCSSCGHAFHHFLGCDWCSCQDPPLPGVQT